MEVVIWGANELGRYVAKNMKREDIDIVPLAFVDNNHELQNTVIDKVDVISYEDLKERKNLREITVLLAVKNAKNIFQILEQLDGTPVANVGIVKPKVGFSGLKVDPSQKEGNVIWSKFAGDTYRFLPRIEVNLIDACNLKCRGCTHFSSIFKNDSVYPIRDYKRDLLQLRKVGQILRLRLLGGEPFLLENLDEYIMITREIFPKTDIEIVTNGLLIPNISHRIVSAMNLNDVSIAISPYRPTLKMKKQIVERLDKHKITWHFEGEEISWFSRNMTLEDTHDPKFSNAKCSSAACTFLRKGKLYKCPLEGMINDFNNYYGLDEVHEGGISVFEDENILYGKTVEYALNPIDMCKYCAEEPESIPWSVEANPSLEDWLYKDGSLTDA